MGFPNKQKKFHFNWTDDRNHQLWTKIFTLSIQKKKKTIIILKLIPKKLKGNKEKEKEGY